ncbi:uncharacterized protein [Pagrus major]|uniref:uncharacterized protein n=1 Tax=Pagrus major TaxID=143350 RepID=UPI003CC8AEDD
MAAVKQHLARGAYDFAQKTCNRYLLKSQKKPGESAIQASSLSAGCLFGDIQNRGLSRAENAADRVTGGVSQDTYTRVTPVFGTDNNVWKNSNVTESYYYYGHNEFSLLDKTSVQNGETHFPRYPSNDKFRRTSCTFRSARRLCWGHGQLVSIRSYSGNGTRSEPLYRTKTGYYDILEVSPTATQAQVKTAYYKQSFIYHPDRNAGGDEATVRFSEISEAYTVLGNKALRKKYDRGLLSQSDLVATARPSGKDTTGGSTKQTDRRRSVVGADIRGGIYDFDKFFKAHYNEQLQREKDLRLRKEEMLRKKQESVADRKLYNAMDIAVVLMLAMAVAILFNLKQK